jgi:hypothetical protein
MLCGFEMSLFPATPVGRSPWEYKPAHQLEWGFDDSGRQNVLSSFLLLG